MIYRIFYRSRRVLLTFLVAFYPVSGALAAAGVLFYRDDAHGRRWLLLGRDCLRHDLSDLGGASDAADGGNPAVTAAREAAEEASFVHDNWVWIAGLHRGDQVDTRGTRTYADFSRAIQCADARRTHWRGYTMLTAPYPASAGADLNTQAGQRQFQQEFARRREHFRAMSAAGRGGWSFQENEDLRWVLADSVRFSGGRATADFGGRQLPLRREFVGLLRDNDGLRAFLRMPARMPAAGGARSAAGPAAGGARSATLKTGPGALTIGAAVCLGVVALAAASWWFFKKRRSNKPPTASA